MIGKRPAPARYLALAVILLCAVPVSSAAGIESGFSDEKLRQLMQQARPQSTASQAGSAAFRGADALSPDRLQERARLLASGEAALTRIDVATALQSFDRAALILHAADTEIALVRSYMQGGEYRRALAFGAHTAGAHLDVIGGAALYAWLLHAGGQGVIAQRLLTEAETRTPGNALLAGVQAELKSGTPVATGKLLAPPTRLAPYGQSRGVPPAAQVLGSGLLLADGRHALVPLALLPRSRNVWLRNGLGQLSRGTVDKRLPETGVALVQLESALPPAEDLYLAAGNAFPGSVGFAVEYVAATNAAPAWPVLRTGFLGGPVGDRGDRLLGIDMPAGPRGGPVFDPAGRLIGLALPGEPVKAAKNGSAGNMKAGDRLVPTSALLAALRTQRQAATDRSPVVTLALKPTAEPPPRAAVDTVYERSLRVTLQLIGVR